MKSYMASTANTNAVMHCALTKIAIITDSSVNLQAPPIATVIPGPSSSSGLQMKTGMTGAPTSNEPVRAGLSQSRKSLLNHSSTGGGADGEPGKPTTCWPAPLRRCRLFLERFGLSD